MKRIAIAVVLAAVCAGSAMAAAKTVATVDGKKVTDESLTKRLWWQHAAQGLSDLIDENLLLEEAKRLGVAADPKEVQARFDALAANYPDKATFAKNLKSVGWTEADLKGLIANQLTIRGAVVASRRLAVTDEGAKAFFDANKDRIGAPEAVRLSQIFVTNKAEADDAYGLLSTVGADFNKLSALKSTDEALKSNSGNLGYISRGMLIPELEREIFALKPGQFSKVIPTGNGFSIFKVEELRPRQEPVFEQVKENLKAAIINQAITEQLPGLVAELRAKAKIEIAK